MKLAWLCYTKCFYAGDEPEIIVVFKEPELWKYDKIIPIVYAEVTK